MSKIEWSQADYNSHLSKLASGLEPAKDLIEFIRKHAPSECDFRTSAPFGVMTDLIASGEEAYVKIHPCMRMRPTHMILSEEAATCFDMTQWRAQNLSEIMEPIPLETFSVKYAADMKDPAKFYSLQEWSHETIEPGMCLYLAVRNSSARSARFRGIVWARVGF